MNGDDDNGGGVYDPRDTEPVRVAPIPAGSEPVRSVRVPRWAAPALGAVLAAAAVAGIVSVDRGPVMVPAVAPGADAIPLVSSTPVRGWTVTATATATATSTTTARVTATRTRTRVSRVYVAGPTVTARPVTVTTTPPAVTVRVTPPRATATVRATVTRTVRVTRTRTVTRTVRMWVD